MELEKNLYLKELIKRRGFRQYEIAKLIGVHDSLISKYILNGQGLSDERKEKLAKILNVKKEDI